MCLTWRRRHERTPPDKRSDYKRQLCSFLSFISICHNVSLLSCEGPARGPGLLTLSRECHLRLGAAQFDSLLVNGRLCLKNLASAFQTRIHTARVVPLRTRKPNCEFIFRDAGFPLVFSDEFTVAVRNFQAKGARKLESYPA